MGPKAVKLRKQASADKKAAASTSATSTAADTIFIDDTSQKDTYTVHTDDDMWDNEAVPSDNEDSIGCALSALQAGDSDDGEDEPSNTATMGAVSASANGPSEFLG